MIGMPVPTSALPRFWLRFLTSGCTYSIWPFFEAHSGGSCPSGYIRAWRPVESKGEAIVWSKRPIPSLAVLLGPLS